MVSRKTSIGLAFDPTINDVIVTGDFNLDMQKPTSSRKIETLCQMYNLSNIISEPTHFTESPSSLIDLFLATNKITYFLVVLANHSLIKILGSIVQLTLCLTLIKQLLMNTK